ncbi:ATP-binding protein [Roseovarius sp. SK2]|uniref:ATP-binding protein n=1 Tax=Roseovarius TaxID=74030 RepID=UPI00237A0EA5|nr:ATP-binding protein [Roseovarius sp. SK2]MDD9727206.1 ATP-binding protein [Roseovarius sp. SK2]
MQIIKASDRMKERGGIKAALFGPSGIGKTTLLKSLDADKTLFFDLEAGDLAVEGWPGDAVRPRTWDDCRTLAALISGPNPALRDEQPYSQAHFNHINANGEAEQFAGYETIFIDSITVAGRLCFQWAQGQPEAFSERSGKPDTRGAYGLHGREMLAWLSCLQHARDRNVIFVGILDQKEDDYGRSNWVPQIEGSKVGRELPGIVDQVITYQEIQAEDGAKFRGLVCTSPNPWGYPAKDRSGRLDQIEKPHLGELFDKIKNGQRHDAMQTDIPEKQEDAA